ncbi:DUF2975 domain-containing protein [Sphingomonas sp.]|uniref:DUF2975 domain-containing protein n=1 Tax=Sphingomonas sp. TaxID=28214 RepID=UPI002E379F89|nr:DUF2975 domain-containing protein [Sphingomonas sp.]HEX4694527.1 DUF2975 domain-containing protein [Sphingomonas sp.]
MTLRILIIFNWIAGALLLALLFVSFQQAAWLWQGLGVVSIAERPGGEAGMRAIVGAGIISVPIAAVVLRALARIVKTVRARDPFTRVNAARIQTIAWALLALQLIHVAVAAIAASIATGDAPLKLGGAGTITGWLAVVLLFVLAGVFREGAAMRDDLEGTV